MQTYTAHFVAPKPYVPLRHILSPGVKLCMGATKCAVSLKCLNPFSNQQTAKSKFWLAFYSEDCEVTSLIISVDVQISMH